MAPPEENTTDNHLRFDEPKFDADGADTGRKPSGIDHSKGGSIYAKPDLENGEEYANLVAYISSYYEGPRRKSVVSMEEQDAAAKKPWWKFWGGKSSGLDSAEGFEVPDDVNLPRVRISIGSEMKTNGVYSGSRPTSSRVSRIRMSMSAGRGSASTNWCVVVHRFSSTSDGY